MSSSIYFNLDQSKILSSGNGLTHNPGLLGFEVALDPLDFSWERTWARHYRAPCSTAQERPE